MSVERIEETPSVDQIALDVVTDWVTQTEGIRRKLESGSFWRSNGEYLEEVSLTERKRQRLSEELAILYKKIDGLELPGRDAGKHFHRSGYRRDSEIRRAISRSASVVSPWRRSA